jgi:hypothetical protein
MSNNTKWVLVILIIVALVSVCVCGSAYFLLNSAGKAIKNSYISDPTQASAIANEIADYTLPPGYTQTGMNFLGLYKAILVVSQDNKHPMIMLLQFGTPGGINQDEFEKQMKVAIQQQFNREGIQWKDISTSTKTIRGQEVTLTLSEGSDQTGQEMRSLTGLFQGKQGQVIMMIMGPISGWDQEIIDAFISSIH